MKKIFILLVLIIFYNPVLAGKSTNEESVLDERYIEEGEVVLKERKKENRKKGKRNVIIQPNEEDDANIIMYLDREEGKD